MHIGVRIKSLRANAGLTIEQLARLSYCSKSYIWDIENRVSSKPSGEKLKNISYQLGVTIEYLLSDGEDEEAAIDKCFYRKYQAMDSATKYKIRMIADIINDNKGLSNE